MRRLAIARFMTLPEVPTVAETGGQLQQDGVAGAAGVRAE